MCGDASATSRRDCAPLWFIVFLLVTAGPALTYPLSWLPKSLFHFRYEFGVPWGELTVGVILFMVAVCAVRRGRETGHWKDDTTPLSLTVLLPLVVLGLSALISTRWSEHAIFAPAALVRLGTNATVFFVATRLPRRELAGLGKWWLAVAAVVAANGLCRLGSEPEFLSTLGNRNFLGAYLAASLVIGICLRNRWGSLGSILLCVALWFCHSRGAWLALALAAAALILLPRKRRILRSRFTRAAVLILLIAVGSILARNYVVQQWQEDVRPPIWRATVRMIAARPFIGHGLGAYLAVYPKYRLPEYFLRPKSTNVTDHAHNEFLEVAAEQGLLGLAATLWLWGEALYYGCRVYRCSAADERPAVVGFLGAAFVFMSHGMVDVDLRHVPNQTLLWLLMGVLVGAGSPSGRLTPHASAMRRWLVAALAALFGLWMLFYHVPRSMMADWLDRKARLAEENRDVESAAAAASRSLVYAPFRLSTRYLLAGLLSRSNSAQAHQLAIDQCLRIEEFSPDYADVSYNLGQLYASGDRPAEALPYLKRAVEIDPYSADRRVALAAVLNRLGNREEALDQVNHALKLKTMSADARTLSERLRQELHP